MNIIFVTLGSRGDLNPFLYLGKILQQRGLRITIISSEIYKNLIETAGFEFITCSSADSYHQIIQEPAFYNPKKSFKMIAEYVILDPMRSVYQALQNFDPRNSVIVATRFMAGARLAQEKLKFPLISTCLQPLTLWSIKQPAIDPTGSSAHRLPWFLRKIVYAAASRWLLDRHISPQINQFRQELGLPNISKLFSHWLYSPQKVLGLFPEWFAEPSPDWPAHTELTGFVADSAPSLHAFESEISAFLNTGEPPIVITYGTSVTRAKDFFIKTLEANRILGYRSLILTQYPEQLPPLYPDRELHIHYAPLQQLLPYCAAIVHHGGAGTLAQAIAAALPQLIIPLINDQLDNAARIEKLGLGLKLSSAKYSILKAKLKINQLINSANIKENCIAYSKRIDFEQAAQLTCDIVQECLKTGP